jgi:hypothetical protein
MSRLSHYGYRPSHINEDMLVSIAERENTRFIVPFNSGVVLLNNGVWNRLDPIRTTYLDLAWRLLSGRALSTKPGIGDHPAVPTAVLGVIKEVDRTRVLPYPSSNAWIIEQIALWLALGHVQEMSQGLLASEQVVQGLEFYDSLRYGNECVVSHYYSRFEAAFFEFIPALED